MPSKHGRSEYLLNIHSLRISPIASSIDRASSLKEGQGRSKVEAGQIAIWAPGNGHAGGEKVPSRRARHLDPLRNVYHAH